MMLQNKTVLSVGELLKSADQTISVAESSTGGLISASLLVVPGASAFYQGGSVVYTLPSRRAYLDLDREKLTGLKPLTEEMVAVFAESARQKLQTTWGIAELGAAGPTGTPYGHDAGISVIGIAGPVPKTTTIQTGSSDREENMFKFTRAAIELLLTALEESKNTVSD